MTTLENKVRDDVQDYAKKHGWWHFRIDYGGWPDRLFVTIHGDYVWMEFKRPKRSAHRLRQQERLKLLLGRGCYAYLVKNQADGYRIVDFHTTHKGVGAAPIPGAPDQPDASPGSGGGTT